MKNKWIDKVILIIRPLLAIVCILCFSCAIWQFADYKKSGTLYQEVITSAVKSEKKAVKNKETETVPDLETVEEPDISVDFDMLVAQNKDTAAWIYFPDTEINYPVVQGKDNSYYLKHLFDQKTGSAGCLFFDSENKKDLSDKNTIIYGHHMKNGSMFAGLMNYKNQDYYESHPTFYLFTPDKKYEVVIFAAYVADYDEKAWQTGFSSETDFGEWLKRIQKKSCIKSVVDASASGSNFAITDHGELRVLTLSTCDYVFEQAKFIVHGYLTEIDD